MTEFFLVRHAQASYGAANYDELSALGHRQAQWLGDYYRERRVHFDALITGDLVRQVETARDILDHAQMPLDTDTQRGLNECDMHRVVRLYLAAHPGERPGNSPPPKVFYRLLKKAMLAWQQDLLGDGLPETWAGFARRVAAVMHHVQSRYADRERVLIVSSGGVIAMWMHHILQTSDPAVADLNMQIRNTSVSQGFFNAQVFRLSTFNTLPHLDRDDRHAAITYS